MIKQEKETQIKQVFHYTSSTERQQSLYIFIPLFQESLGTATCITYQHKASAAKIFIRKYIE
jgi:hypothetical protein